MPVRRQPSGNYGEKRSTKPKYLLGHGRERVVLTGFSAAALCMKLDRALWKSFATVHFLSTNIIASANRDQWRRRSADRKPLAAVTSVDQL